MEDYRQRVAKGPPAEDGVGVRFYRAFWKPLELYLAGAKRVYVSPDGVLNTISWEAVPTDDGRLLTERYEVDILLSTKNLLRQSHSASMRSAVLVGNPKFDLGESEQRIAVAQFQATRGCQTSLASVAKQPSAAEHTKANEPVSVVPEVAGGWRSRDEEKGPLVPLGETQKELESIRDLLNKQQWQVQSYTRQCALEEVIKSVKSPTVLHLATHGYFEPDQSKTPHENMGDQPSGLEDPMLRSGLYFTGADRARSGGPPAADLEDGVLTAYEATGLMLQGTELVVLSACKTGLGEAQDGEGVFGLRRALQEAGAEAVLMSMWSVPVEDTQKLMGLFYEKWLSGEDKHKALHESQLQLRQEVKAKWGDDRPYYWAAFVLVGR
jgi:CHAT domain-containing protein